MKMLRYLIALTSLALLASQAAAENVCFTPVIQNAAYASGNCMGNVTRVAFSPETSILSQTTVSSQGGLVTGKVVYLFRQAPTATTCQDKVAFSLGSADVSLLLKPPVLITPAVQAGTTVSSGSDQNEALSISPNGVIYAAVVDTTTETPATVSDLVVCFSGI